MILQGVLHDVFVLVKHEGPYARELLRLLMDGHILITCGLVQVLSFSGIQDHAAWAYGTAILASLSLVVYCLLIFPFLKSFATLLLNASCATLLIVDLLS